LRSVFRNSRLGCLRRSKSGERAGGGIGDFAFLSAIVVLCICSMVERAVSSFPFVSQAIY